MLRDPRTSVRLCVARVMAAVLMAGTLTVVHGATDPAPAKADPERSPRSSTSGLVAPEIATDVIPTNIVIAPGSGESFAPVTVVAVQKVPMTKILRDGSVDPDQALAYWIFSIRYPRGSMFWPPWVPEPPNNPWRWHFYQMPDNQLVGIGVEQGSPLYPPQGPADLLQRLIPAADAAIPQSTWLAAVNVRVEDVDNTGAGGDAPPPPQAACPAAFGLDDEQPCEEEERWEEAFEENGQAPPAAPNPGVPPAPTQQPQGGRTFLEQVGGLCRDTFFQTEACLAAVAIAGGIISKVLDKKQVTDMHSRIPCFGQTADVVGWMAVSEGLLIAAAFKPSDAAIGIFAGLAVVAFVWGMVQFVEQVRICGELARMSLWSGLWAPAVAAAALAAMAVSIVAILGVAYTAANTIDAVRQWWNGNAH